MNTTPARANATASFEDFQSRLLGSMPLWTGSAITHALTPEGFECNGFYPFDNLQFKLSRAIRFPVESSEFCYRYVVFLDRKDDGVGKNFYGYIVAIMSEDDETEELPQGLLIPIRMYSAGNRTCIKLDNGQIG